MKPVISIGAICVLGLWGCGGASVSPLLSQSDSTQLLRESSLTDRVNYRAVARYSERRGGVALRILHQGDLVFESYQQGYTPDTPHPLASGTKSFTCAYAVLAESEGLISPAEVAADTLVEWQSDPLKSQITLSQMLSLSSGLEDNQAFNPFQIEELDAYQLALDATALYPPGQDFIYGATNFLAFALLMERKTAGQDPVAYLSQRLFDPLGFTSLSWQRDALGNPQMAGGARLSAKDWATYGQLFLQQGSWQGQQLLDPDLVERCYTFTNSAFLGYGYTWWLNIPYGETYTPGVDQVPADGLGTEGQIAPSAPTDLYMAAGLGKQRLYIIPSEALVVVRLATSNRRSESWSDEEFLRLVLGLDWTT